MAIPQVAASVVSRVLGHLSMKGIPYTHAITNEEGGITRYTIFLGSMAEVVISWPKKPIQKQVVARIVHSHTGEVLDYYRNPETLCTDAVTAYRQIKAEMTAKFKEQDKAIAAQKKATKDLLDQCRKRGLTVKTAKDGTFLITLPFSADEVRSRLEAMS